MIENKRESTPKPHADLNAPQAVAADHPSGPLLVLAGAGTGKTRVIIHRIAGLIRRGVAPERILAVTFTNKAAGEMRERLEKMVPGSGRFVWMSTFHSFACQILRRHAKLLELTPHFSIYDQDDQKRVVREVLKELKLEDQKNKASLFVNLISRAKDDLLDADSYGIHAMTAVDSFKQTVAKVYASYDRKLRANGALDFGDLMVRLVELLRDHAEVREHYQDRFEHLLVDEYQDTNRAQYWITKTLAGKHRNLCVVGDDDQLVYEWRGADLRNILDFERDFPDAKVVKLEQNYRSTPNILRAATKVILNNRHRKEKTLWTDRGDGDDVELLETGNETEESRSVALRAQAAIDEGVEPSEIAVFYRTNAQSRSFEDAFRNLRIPYRLVGTLRFYERKEVKDILAYARLLLNPADGIGLQRVINVPQRGIGKTSLERLEGFAAEKGVSLYEALVMVDRVPKLTETARRGVREFLYFLDSAREKSAATGPSAAIQDILNRTGYLDKLEEEAESDVEAVARLNNLQELVNAVGEYEEGVKREGREPSLADYLETVALATSADVAKDDSKAITLMTVHLSKGLEFRRVFLTGLEEGLFPIGTKNVSPEEIEEERRLAYVGMTRAKERLVISWALTRRMFGQVYSNLLSRFAIEAQLVPETRGGPRRFVPGKRFDGPSTEPQAGTAPPKVSADLNPWLKRKIKVGMRVRHPDFGYGKVLTLSGSGETEKISVRFDRGVVKKLMVRYAPIEPA